MAGYPWTNIKLYLNFHMRKKYSEMIAELSMEGINALNVGDIP